MAESLLISMATSISTNKATQTRLASTPTLSKHPPRNSIPETKYVIRWGNGTLASTSVSYIVCVLLATNNLFAPEMAKNSPIETRTSRMAYCSKSLLPSSANWTKRFQSISCPSRLLRQCSKPPRQSESPSPHPDQKQPAPSYEHHSDMPSKRSRSYRTQPRPSSAATH